MGILNQTKGVRKIQMNQYEEDVEEDDDEEDVEEAKTRRQKRFKNKKAHNRHGRGEIIPPKYRMEKVKRKAHRPKISWNDYDADYDQYGDY